ncbi:MAG: TIGR01212 family radical SAM protein, partial [Oscillospiraceae bacterium]
KPTYLKVHLLHILKNTVIAKQYCAGEFGLMTQEDYVNLVCDQLEIIPPEVVIQRLTGDGEKQSLIGPLWSLKKFCVLNDIDKELVRRNSWQGKYAKIDL